MLGNKRPDINFWTLEHSIFATSIIAEHFRAHVSGSSPCIHGNVPSNVPWNVPCNVPWCVLSYMSFWSSFVFFLVRSSGGLIGRVGGKVGGRPVGRPSAQVATQAGRHVARRTVGRAARWVGWSGSRASGWADGRLARWAGRPGGGRASRWAGRLLVLLTIICFPKFVVLFGAMSVRLPISDLGVVFSDVGRVELSWLFFPVLDVAFFVSLDCA